MKEKEQYISPLSETLELRQEGVICGSEADEEIIE